MKIGLINTAFNEDSPPLNLAYLTAALKLNGFNDIRIIDHTFRRRDILKEVKGLDLVGISAMTRYYKTACKTAREIKKKTGIPVIIGGSHITTASDSLSQDFELGVVGEGEETIVRLCRSFQPGSGFNPGLLNNIPGLVYREGGRLCKTAAAPLISELDTIPMPDLAIIDKRYFKKKWIIWSNRMGRSMKIVTSRGCPYNCIFCASKKIWRQVRLHSAQRIFTEVHALVKDRGIDHIYIDDDLFIVNRERLAKFSALMEQCGLNGKVAFFCSARTNLLDDDICRLLVRMGVKVLNFGFESGSDKVLKSLKGDTISVESHKRAIQLCNKYDLKVWGSLMMGSPGEDINDMKETVRFIDFAIENKCQRIGVFVASPLPGTEFWETAKRRGMVSESMDWDSVDYGNYGFPMLLDPGVSREEFKAVFKEASAKADSLLFKDRGFMTLLFRSKKIIGNAVRDPGRAVSIISRMLKRG